MRPLNALATGLLAAGLAAASIPAFAQSGDASNLSKDELRSLFETQKTRGLVLAPSGGTATTASTETSTVADPPQTTYVQVEREQQVNIQISFDFDSAALRNDQKPKLASLCEVMSTIDVQVFQIVGHTDTSGSASYNQNLSQLRAEEVKRYMVQECGIDPNRLEAVGVGEQFPLDTANPESDENRRVEFQALG